MNLAKTQAFMDALNLDIAVERVAENETLPQRWRENADHYRAMLSRPGTREYHYQFSTTGIRRRIPSVELLALLAVQMDAYEKNPTIESWCARMGIAYVEDVAEQWHTFEEDQRALMRFFGEHYADFLELAHD